MLMPTDEHTGKASGPDLTTLRTVRVLRPLKLVSGVPSESITSFQFIDNIFRKNDSIISDNISHHYTPIRSPGCDVIYRQGHRPPGQHCPAPPLRHHHICHHRSRVLRRGPQQNLLRRHGPEWVKFTENVVKPGNWLYQMKVRHGKTNLQRIYKKKRIKK